jgi:hypothetical protein
VSDSISSSLQLLSTFEMRTVLKFSTFYSRYSAKRFLFARDSAGSGQSRSAASWRVRGYRQDTKLQLYRVPVTFDYFDVGDVRCTQFTGPAATPAVACRDLQTCDTPRDPRSGDHLLRVQAGPAHSTGGSCTDSSIAEGVVAIDGYFGGPAYTIAAVKHTLGDLDATVQEWLTSRNVKVVASDTSVAVDASVVRTIYGNRTQARIYISKFGPTVDADAPADVPVSLHISSTPQPAMPWGGTAASANAVACDVSDVAAFDLKRGVGLGDIVACVISIVGGGTRACRTLDDYHRACAASVDCVGFSTTLKATRDQASIAVSDDASAFVEEPLYLHTRTEGYTPRESITSLLPYGGAVVRDVIYYAKTLSANRTCIFPMKEAGDVSIALLQSSFTTGYAQIAVVDQSTGQRTLVKECGGLKTFAASSPATGAALFGTSDSCFDYMLCETITGLTANDRIEVTASSTLLQGSCNHSLSVLATVSAATRESANRTRANLLSTDGYTSRGLFIPTTSQSSVQLKVFVLDAMLSTVRVAQTAYECTSARRCDAPVVKVVSQEAVGDSMTASATTRALGHCGGNVSFGSQLPGQSGQCDLNFDCSSAPYSLNASVARSFTGWMLVTVDTAFVRTASSGFTSTTYCSEFSATVHVLPAAPVAAVNSTTTTAAADTPSVKIGNPVANVFPLALTPSASAPLVTLPIAFLTADANSVALAVRSALFASPGGTTSSVLRTRKLFPVGPLGEQLVAVAVEWNELPPMNTLHSTAASSLTLACVADVITASRHTCTVPVPAGANRVRVGVAQSDFSANALTVKFYDENMVEAVSRTTECGATKSFSGFSGLRGECEKYLSCVNGFIYPLTIGSSESTSAGTNYTTMELSMTNSLTNGGCDFAFSAMIEFSFAAFESPDTCTSGYFCAADRKCIAAERVCDGVSADCGDLADESTCGSFLLVDNNATLDLSKIIALGATSVTAATQLECRRLAVMGAAQGFIFADVGTTCILLPFAVVEILRASPSAYYSTLWSPSTLYLQLTSASDFRKCTAVLHCGSHGKLRKSSTLADGAACVCDCDKDYTGSSCSVLRSIGTPAQYLAVMPRPDSAIVFAALEDALSAGNKAVTIAAQALLPYNTTHAAVPFTFASFDIAALNSYTASLFSAGTLSTVNTRLASLKQAPISFIFSTDGVSGFVQMSTCALNPNSRRYDCAVTEEVDNATSSAAAVGRLLLSGIGFEEYSITAVVKASPESAASSQSGSRRQKDSTGTAATQTLSLECTDKTLQYTKTNLLSTCFTTNCILPISTNLLSLSITPLAGASVDLASNRSSTCAATIVAQAAAIRDVPEAIADADVRLYEFQQHAFLYSGLAISGYVIIAIVMTVLGLFHLNQSYRIARAAVASIQIFNQLPHWIAGALVNERLFHFPVGIKDTTVVAITVSTLMISGVVGLLIILFLTSGYESSNYAVLLEFYQSPVCPGSEQTLLTMPFQATAIEATDQCAALSVVGQSDGALAGRATCTVDPHTGVRQPGVALAATVDQCKGTRAISAITPGSCMNAAAIGSTVQGYVVLRCVELTSARDILAAFSKLNPSESQSTKVSTLPAPPQTAPTADPTSKKITVRPYASESILGQASSHSPDRLSAVAESRLFSGEFLQKRLVLHTNDSFNRLDGVSADAPREAGIIEALYRRQLNALPENLLAQYTPRDEDYPVGTIYGGYGTINEVAGANAGPASHRYFHLQGSHFDIGKYFGPDTTSSSDGFTISMWLRVSSTTDGFAFILCDHFEDTTSRTSPVVERLMGIARDGTVTSRLWFQSSFRVYASLFVGGQSEVLQLTFADPLDDGFKGSSVVTAQWNARDLNVALFNDQWHHVSLSFKNENKHPFVVIGIDGRTSLSSALYRRCLPRRPSPITDQQEIKITSATRDTTASARQGGVMYVGYFNGGLRGLEFTPEFESGDAAVRQGTRQMRVRNATRRTSMEGVFQALCIAAVIAFFCIVYKLRQIHQQRRAVEQVTIDYGHSMYRHFQRKLFTKHYTPVEWVVAAEFLKLDDFTLANFILELIKAPLDDPMDVSSSKLVRCMWIEVHRSDYEGATLAEIMAATPTREEWQRLLEECDVVEPDALLPVPEGDVEDGIAPTGASYDANAAAGVGPAQINSVLLSVIATIQAASIYASTWKLPSVYLDRIVPLLDIFSLDFFTFLNLPTLVGPVVQLVAALVLLTLLAFVFVKDDKRFFSNVLRYQHRRDSVERLHSPIPQRVMHYLLSKVDSAFMMLESFAYEYKVHLLEPEERCALQTFIARPMPEGTEEDVCVVHRKENGETFNVVKHTNGEVLMFPGERPPTGATRNPLALPRRLTRASVATNLPLTAENVPEVQKRRVSTNTGTRMSVTSTIQAARGITRRSPSVSVVDSGDDSKNNTVTDLTAFDKLDAIAAAAAATAAFASRRHRAPPQQQPQVELQSASPSGSPLHRDLEIVDFRQSDASPLLSPGDANRLSPAHGGGGPPESVRLSLSKSISPQALALQLSADPHLYLNAEELNLHSPESAIPHTDDSVHQWLESTVSPVRVRSDLPREPERFSLFETEMSSRPDTGTVMVFSPPSRLVSSAENTTMTTAFRLEEKNKRDSQGSMLSRPPMPPEAPAGFYLLDGAALLSQSNASLVRMYASIERAGEVPDDVEPLTTVERPLGSPGTRKASGVLASDGDAEQTTAPNPLDLSRMNSGMAVSKKMSAAGLLGRRLSRRPMAKALRPAAVANAGVERLTKKKRADIIDHKDEIEIAMQNVSSDDDEEDLDDYDGDDLESEASYPVPFDGDDDREEADAFGFRAFAGMTHARLPRRAPVDELSAGADDEDDEGPPPGRGSGADTLSDGGFAPAPFDPQAAGAAARERHDEEALAAREERITSSPHFQMIVTGDGGEAKEVLTLQPENKRRTFGVAPVRIDHHCVQHRDELLVPVEHSAVFPYSTRRSCCVVESGVRCGAHQGTLYCCPHVTEQHDDDGEVIPEGDERRSTADDCGYAICENHLQVSSFTRLRLQAHTIIRRYTRHGKLWIASLMTVNLAIALYTPTMRTCLMILACHPLYQCEFPQCWSVLDQRFSAAVYLSGLAVVFYGLAFPLTFYLILRNRFRVLSDVFKSSVYEGHFLRPLEAHDTPENNLRRVRFSFAVSVVGYVTDPRLFLSDLSDLLKAAASSFASSVRRLFGKDDNDGDPLKNIRQRREGMASRGGSRGAPKGGIDALSQQETAVFAGETRAHSGSASSNDADDAIAEEPTGFFFNMDTVNAVSTSMADPAASLSVASMMRQALVPSPTHNDSGEKEGRVVGDDDGLQIVPLTIQTTMSSPIITTPMTVPQDALMQVTSMTPPPRTPSTAQSARTVHVLDPHQTLSAARPPPILTRSASFEGTNNTLMRDNGGIVTTGGGMGDRTESSSDLNQTQRTLQFTLRSRRNASKGISFTIARDETIDEKFASPRVVGSTGPSPRSVLVPGRQPSSSRDHGSSRPSSNSVAFASQAPPSATRSSRSGGSAHSGGGSARGDSGGASGTVDARRRLRSWFVPPAAFTDVDGDAEAVAALRKRNSNEFADISPKDLPLNPADTSAGTKLKDTYASSDATSLRAASVVDPATGMVIHRTQQVSTAEWQRFLLTDASILVPLYWQVSFERMATVPLQHCTKFLLLIPPLLLEPNSFEQLLFIALGELLYATAILYLAPFLSLWMAIIVLLGNIHQFVIVGLQALYAARANEVDLNNLLGPVMLGCTLAYLSMIILIIGIMFILPILTKNRANAALTKVFNRYCLSRPSDAPLYVRPFDAFGSTGVERSSVAPSSAHQRRTASAKGSSRGGIINTPFRLGTAESEVFGASSKHESLKRTLASSASGAAVADRDDDDLDPQSTLRGGILRRRSTGISSVGTRGYDEDVTEAQVLADLITSNARVKGRRRSAQAAPIMSSTFTQQAGRRRSVADSVLLQARFGSRVSSASDHSNHVAPTPRSLVTVQVTPRCSLVVPPTHLGATAPGNERGTDSTPPTPQSGPPRMILTPRGSLTIPEPNPLTAVAPPVATTPRNMWAAPRASLTVDAGGNSRRASRTGDATPRNTLIVPEPYYGEQSSRP